MSPAYRYLHVDAIHRQHNLQRPLSSLLFTGYSCLSVLSGTVLGLYSSDDDVVELTSENVGQMLSSDRIWFVEFYAPWCGHCQKLVPEWKKVASALKVQFSLYFSDNFLFVMKGVVEVAAVNTDEQPSLTSKYNIKSFPTILIFAKDKVAPIPYTGARNALTITNEALQHVKRLVESRVNGESSDRSGGGDKSGNSDVIELTDSNFDEIVLNSEEPWLVEFYAPWCGHCKNLKPHWDRAAAELKGVMKVGAVDATVHDRLSQKYGVSLNLLYSFMC
ncbi:protein disulfide-isomerase A6 [Paragonimus westermani]|uniref:Protein disulfide-isomerase A6 n=1 Tax=Paragonimus westermani TaxID=34504 RepID=A0A5J4N6Q7_9TREM|nr:protein disulfide-isomerase A6 [Paragonimus westermani]